MLPNFIGIGVAKSGSTWLSRCLRDHPQVFMAAVKETNFFDHPEHIFSKGIHDYESHFVGAEEFRAVGEISTPYFHSERATERIKTCIPDVRLVVTLRNPIEQTYSNYWHLLKQRFNMKDDSSLPKSFEEALEKYGWLLIDRVLYHKHLQRWLQSFDRSQLHIIFHDDIKAQPQAVLSSLYGFLGVDNDFTPPSISKSGASVRRGTSPRSVRVGRVHAYLHDRISRRIYRPLERLIGARKAGQIRNALRIREGMDYLFQRKGYPEMRSETRAFLRKQFAEDIENLSVLTGRDLNHWK